MLEIIALLVFAGLLIYAAVSDAASLTIPNWVSLALVGAFPLAALVLGIGLGQIGLHLLFGAGVLVATFFLFQANVLGGGDAKLIAAVAVWCGSTGFLPFLFATALAGGGLAALLMVARANVLFLPGAPSFVNRLLEPKAGIPYGVAIMAGGLAAIESLPFSAALTLP